MVEASAQKIVTAAKQCAVMWMLIFVLIFTMENNYYPLVKRQSNLMASSFFF
jgi:hypothetical protein